MNKREVLKNKIIAAQKELDELEKLESDNECIKNLEDYTPEEKIEFFDKMYQSAWDELDELRNNGYSNEDNAGYVWETYIEILAKNKKEFWNYWNSLSN